MRKSTKSGTIATGFLSTVLMLGLAGCAASTPAADSGTLQRTELNFSINQCQQQSPGLFKCPAIDKPICSPDYNGTAIECLHTNKNGTIQVQQLQTP